MMHPCRFPLAPTTLCKKNENLDIKVNGDNISFKIGDITFKNSQEPVNKKRRIVLTHKITGDTIIYNNVGFLTFRPEIAKLNPVISGSAIGASYSDLTREFGSTKAKKQLRENEKLQINKEAQQALRVAQKEAILNEKVEASKGNKSYLNCTLDTSMSATSLENAIDSDGRIKLSTIVPKEVFESLQSEAETIINLKFEEIEKLSGDLSFSSSILELIKRWPTLEMRKLQLTVMLEYMMRFYNLPVKSVRSKIPLKGCPVVCMKFIIQNYTREVISETKGSNLNVGKEEKERLLFMITIFYGYLHDNEYPLKHLLYDVKIGRDRIKKLAALVHARIIAISKEYYFNALKPYIIEDL